MGTYKHGIYTREQATSLTPPIPGTAGLQVVVGTAPIFLVDHPEEAVNKPVLVNNFKEAADAFGYIADFESWTLCESVAANFQVVGTGPMILINVLDPKKHTTEVDEKTIPVNDKKASVAAVGLLLDGLTVTADEGTSMTIDTDYTVAYNEDGTATIALIEGGAGKSATTISVTGKKLDPGKITEADIVGGVDIETGAETGMEVIRQIYPKYGMTPGILLAPRWSAKAVVDAALQAKTKNINGVFGAVCVADVDCSAEGATKYTDVKIQKEKQTLTDTRCYAVWPYGRVGDMVYSGSALAAAMMAYTDAINADTPNVSPSNKTIAIGAACLADGTEIYLDQEQANAVNGMGVATWLNINGFRLWGNNTCCYPGNSDPKDRWISVRRFLTWAANTFILTYFSKVDSPANTHLIENIVDSENIRGNSFVARGICARYEIVFREEENPVTDLMNGKLTFHQFITPFTPAENIEDVIEFDPNALTAALLG